MRCIKGIFVPKSVATLTNKPQSHRAAGPSSATWRRRERGDRIPAQHQCAAGNDERKQTAMPLLLAKGVSGTPI
ncbi:hypothetical protein KL933_001449 [Ogataea haglerorum]|uniref:Uncharacterized protein n=1 Tax=Ogataea haglerorum TaxID=1937702 RepID=A0AAN6I1W2_9ASCO|nr:hypothetical protein KL915_002219 [Ogataea haglerorum]KAG7709664.1 hypothetical protein KL950_001883 [Ogataea haglerorum]KAG7729223.1 hypothetical protein KL933_001449 [Ogataea haglerorum]KAG7732197.1 hypothetical protein KL948_002395 [Ogataea haglerorum]KAG7738677.1 hypothetical protein KL932_003570 [Ogataea haglerorum]